MNTLSIFPTISLPKINSKPIDLKQELDEITIIDSHIFIARNQHIDPLEAEKMYQQFFNEPPPEPRLTHLAPASSDDPYWWDCKEVECSHPQAKPYWRFE